MTVPDEQRLLAFLEGGLSSTEREELIDRLEADPSLSERLRRAAAGLESVQSVTTSVQHPVESVEPPSMTTSVPRWWLAAAVAATLAVAVPTTLAVGSARSEEAALATGMPTSPDPSFVVVVHGVWPDRGSVTPDEAAARANEYWAWTTRLAEEGVLVAAGDLRWEEGQRLVAIGAATPATPAAVEGQDFVVGMFALRVGSYAEAVERARECPHLRYGGSVSVRRVGGGFVTVPGMGDWAP